MRKARRYNREGNESGVQDSENKDVEGKGKDEEGPEAPNEENMNIQGKDGEVQQERYPLRAILKTKIATTQHHLHLHCLPHHHWNLLTPFWKLTSIPLSGSLT